MEDLVIEKKDKIVYIPSRFDVDNEICMYSGNKWGETQNIWLSKQDLILVKEHIEKLLEL